MSANLRIKVTADTAQAGRELSGFTAEVKSGIGGLMGALSGVGLAAQGLGSIVDAAKGVGSALGVGLASEMEMTKAQFMAFTKDAGKTEEILALVRKEAASTPFAFQEMAKATAALQTSAKQANEPLLDLVRTGEILAASNPAEGLEGAAFALKEAVSGDFTSIIERFNLPRQMINQLKAEGVPALEVVRRAMKEMGLDMDLVGNLAKTTSGRFSSFQDAVDTVRIAVGQPILEALGVQLDRLAGFLAENEEAMVGLATVVGTALATAMETGATLVMRLREQFEEWWPQIQQVTEGIREHLQPVLDFLARNIDSLVIPALIALGAVAVAQIAAIVIAAGPLVLTIGGISAAIMLLSEAWNSNWGDIQGKTAAVVGFITGAFKGLIDLENTLAQKMRELGTAVHEGAANAIAAASRLGDEIIAIFLGLGGRALDAGRKIIGGLQDGINQKLADAKATVLRGLESIDRLFPHSNAEEGPFMRGPNWDILEGNLPETFQGIKRTVQIEVTAIAHEFDNLIHEAEQMTREMAVLLAEQTGDWTEFHRIVARETAGAAIAISQLEDEAVQTLGPGGTFTTVLMEAGNAVENTFGPSGKVTSSLKSGWAQAASIMAEYNRGANSLIDSLNSRNQAPAGLILNMPAPTSSAVPTATPTSNAKGKDASGNYITDPSAPGFDWAEFNFARNTGAIPRAEGGPVWPWQSYTVGERGPERFVPGVPGTILPNGGGSRPLTVVVELDRVRFARATVADLTTAQGTEVRLAAI